MTITCDFELGFIRACEVVFPESRIQGCFFHFMQSMWRHIKDIGLCTIYRNSTIHRTLLKLPFVLAFCPIQDIESNFNKIKDKFKNDDHVTPKINEFYTY